MVSLEAARAELPDLNKLVPSRADNNGVLRIRAKSHARNPVLMSLLGDSELAVTKSVPELDCPIAGSGNNLSVIGREGDRENIIGVSNKSAGGSTGGELPETESLVPRSRESVGAVRGDDAVRNNVGVAVKGSFWVTVGSFVASQIPDNQRLIARS